MENTTKLPMIPTTQPQVETWDRPLPLHKEAVKPFPLECLPAVIQDYVRALSENVQTPPDMAATIVLCILAALLQGRFHISIKDNWEEPLNLYSLIVLPPSERKSAIMNTLLKPLIRLEKQANDNLAEKIQKSESVMRVLLGKQAALEKKATKGEDVSEELDEINAEIADFRQVKPFRFYLDNVTPEKITSCMAENNGCAAIFSSEGGLFDIMSGSYSSNTNIDVLLKAYSGDSLRCDRITRASETIDRPRLTMQLMSQPSVLEKLMQNDVFRSRGLTARFLYCIPDSAVGSRQFFTPPIPPEMKVAYEHLLQDMFTAELPPEKTIPVEVSQEALLVLGDYFKYLEADLKTVFAEIEEWSGKLVGNMTRIAGILTVVQYALQHPGEFHPEAGELIVDEDTMVKAIIIGMYYQQHAKAAFNLTNGEKFRQQCRQILKVIHEKNWDTFTRRDMMRSCHQFRTADDIQQPLNHLEECGFIRAEEDAPLPGRGRKANLRYLVNPLFLSDPDLIADAS